MPHPTPAPAHILACAEHQQRVQQMVKGTRPSMRRVPTTMWAPPCLLVFKPQELVRYK